MFYKNTKNINKYMNILSWFWKNLDPRHNNDHCELMLFARMVTSSTKSSPTNVGRDEIDQGGGYLGDEGGYVYVTTHDGPTVYRICLTSNPTPWECLSWTGTWRSEYWTPPLICTTYICAVNRIAYDIQIDDVCIWLSSNPNIVGDSLRDEFAIPFCRTVRKVMLSLN